MASYPTTEGARAQTYDAIVIGSGISGGWAAKELCEQGLRTLVLERGRDVKHGDYPTAMLDACDFPGRTRGTAAAAGRQEKQGRTGYTTHPSSAHWFVDDVDHPYEEKKRFDWMRGYHVGGRSLLWGRQSYRFSDLDFEANGKEGVAVDWPIRYADLAPWYDYAERFAGISGDYFYAHTDETSLEGSIFERRVAHGYFLISAAAGLFVDPKKGPVLANYGLDNLRFVQPVYVGDTIQVQLTCMRKTMKDRREGQIPQGVVEWYVEVTNQRKEKVAIETVLTLVACRE